MLLFGRYSADNAVADQESSGYDKFWPGSATVRLYGNGEWTEYGLREDVPDDVIMRPTLLRQLGIR